MEEEAFVIIELTWVGISAKLSSLRHPDKRGHGIDPAILYLLFAVDPKIEGNKATSG